ncbi:Vam6/Vps39-like protein [Sparganum proliferum]
MHEAFYPIRLIKNNHYEFESISCYQNYLLLGAKSGLLLIYEVVPANNSQTKAFVPPDKPDRRTRQVEPLVLSADDGEIAGNPRQDKAAVNFELPSFNVRVCATHHLSKKRVLQLRAVPEYGLFLALTDLHLAAYRLSDRQLVAVVPNSRGASHFAVLFKAGSDSRSMLTSPRSARGYSGSGSKQSGHTEEVRLSDGKQCPSLYLCACSKRKLSFYGWSPEQRKFLPPSALSDAAVAKWPDDYTLSEPAICIQFCGLDMLMVGLRSEYLCIKLSTREAQTIATPNKLAGTLMSPLPYCLDQVVFQKCRTTTNSSGMRGPSSPTHLDHTDDRSDNENSTSTIDPALESSSWMTGSAAPFALASDDQLFTLLPNAGSIDEKPAFRWSGIPQCFQVCPPYLLAGLTKVLEVWSLDPYELTQTLQIPSVRAMCYNNGWLYATAAASTASSPSVSGVASPSGSPITTSGGSDVWLLLAANRPNLIRYLIQRKEFEIALKLATFTHLSAQPALQTEELAALYAFHLFDRDRQFEKALNLFCQLNTDPFQVLGLCPGMLPEDFSGELKYPSTPVPLTEDEKKMLLEPLITYLVRWRNRLRASTSSTGSPSTHKTAQHASSQVLLHQFFCSPIVPRTQTNELQHGLPRLSLLQLVDTCLLKCYLVTNIARVGPLLRQENYCHLEEAERVLTLNHRYTDLVTMYRARGFHQQALRVLTKVTLGTVEAEKVDTSNEAHTPDLIVAYLKDLDPTNFELVAQFGDWIMNKHPKSWMSIFVAWERELRRKVLSAAPDSKSFAGFAYRDQVIRHLEKHASHLIIPFLERIIFMPHDWDDEMEENGEAEEREEEALRVSNLNSSGTSPSTPQSTALSDDMVNPTNGSSLVTLNGNSQNVCDVNLFTCLWPLPRPRRLVTHSSVKHRLSRNLPMRSEQEPDPDDLPEIDPLPSSPEPTELHNRYARALIRQIQTLQPDPTKLALRVDEEEPPNGPIARLRRRLLHFLVHPQACFSATSLLPKLPYDACFEERALLFAKLRRHEQALTLWIHLLNQWERALQHCAQVQMEAERRAAMQAQAKRVSPRSDATAANAVAQQQRHQHQQQKQQQPEDTAEPPEIYTLLFEVCLNPLEPIALGIVPPSRGSTPEAGPIGSPMKPAFTDLKFEPRLDLALNVLQSFGERVNAPKILRALPESISLHDMANFLECTVKQQESIIARLVFFLGAARSESIQSRKAHAEATAGRLFKVSASATCRQCRRRIGASAFVRYPDSGDLVHYGCCRDLSGSVAVSVTTASSSRAAGSNSLT